MDDPIRWDELESTKRCVSKLYEKAPEMKDEPYYSEINKILSAGLGGHIIYEDVLCPLVKQIITRKKLSKEEIDFLNRVFELIE